MDLHLPTPHPSPSCYPNLPTRHAPACVFNYPGSKHLNAWRECCPTYWTNPNACPHTHSYDPKHPYQKIDWSKLE